MPRRGSGSSRKRAVAALNHPNIVAIYDVNQFQWPRAVYEDGK